jgi:hypothetical protein
MNELPFLSAVGRTLQQAPPRGISLAIIYEAVAAVAGDCTDWTFAARIETPRRAAGLSAAADLTRRERFLATHQPEIRARDEVHE